MTSPFETELIEQTPSLRAHALGLTRRAAQADDLVQDTLERAWRHKHRFADGTNMRAWLLTILRHVHYNAWRRDRRWVDDGDGVHAGRVAEPPAQSDSVEIAQALTALGRMDPSTGRAVLLVAIGLTYDEVAQDSGDPLRTVQSRVRRGREKLLKLETVD